MLCTDCKKDTPLDDLVRKYPVRDLGFYVCKDCLTPHNAGMYPLVFPLEPRHTQQERRTTAKLLRWLVG